MSDVLALDGKQYQLDSLSDAAKAQVQNVRVVDAEIQRVQNILAIYQTARNGYLSALKKELEGAAE